MVSKRSYEKLIQQIESLAGPNVAVETIGRFEAEGAIYPMLTVTMGNPGHGKARVLIASGIHGDEPAGVEAALRYIERNDNNTALLDRFSFTIYPCNNPTGWERNTRENWRGVDLNREFSVRKPEPEAKIIMDSLQGRCYDLVFEMHEDIDSPGFYLYEIAEDASYHVGERIIEAVRGMGHPVNTGECIEGMPAKDGLIRRKSFRFRKTKVPQAIYMFRTCGGHVLTLEPPVSMLPEEERIRILLTGLEVALGLAP